MTDQNHFSRRQILKGGAALAAAATLPGCGPQLKDKLSRQDMLQGLQDTGAVVIDQTGQVINLKALATTLNGTASTISFMFANCGDICPTTALTLHGLSEQDSSLQHIVISADPYNDLLNEDVSQRLSYKLAAQGLFVDGAQRNTTILFPTSHGIVQAQTPDDFKNNEASLRDGNNFAFLAQGNMSMLTRGRDLSGHSGAITLFGANGEQLIQARPDDLYAPAPSTSSDKSPTYKDLPQALATYNTTRGR